MNSEQNSLQSISNITVVADAVAALNDYGISAQDFCELSIAWFQEREGWLCHEVSDSSLP